MITPRFEVTQDEEFIIITMRVPYIKVSEMEYSISQDQFTFYAKPYFLRLTFPHQIVEDGREKAKYDIDKGQLEVRLPKEIKGQFFENLDMLTQLLAKKKQPRQPLIEVIGKTGGEREEVQGGEKEEEEDEEDYEFEQKVPEPESSLLGVKKTRYGFNKQYSDFFGNLQEDLKEILTIPNPDDIPQDTWRDERIRAEDDKFDPDHYMADFMLEGEIAEALAFVPRAEKDLKRKLALKKRKRELAANSSQTEHPPAQKPPPSTDSETQISPPATPSDSSTPKTDSATPTGESEEKKTAPPPTTHLTPASITSPAFINPTPPEEKSPSSSSSPPPSSSPHPQGEKDLYSKQSLDEEAVPFSDEDRLTLMNLPNKEYIIANEKVLLLSLVDIMFAYCYNNRTTLGENTVESAWTIGTLSPTLSCLETFNSLQSTIISCVRRSLSYPLFRHWGLAMKVLQDTRTIFRLGKRAVLRALLDVHRLFELHDTKHYLDKLYIIDYCVWVQQQRRSVFKKLFKQLKQLQISKDVIGWPLDYLEQRAREEFGPDPDDE